jgi:hypothetical protein
VSGSGARMLVASSALVVSMIMSACASPLGQAALPAQPDFVGFITTIERGPGPAEARLGVESHADKIVHRHVVTVARDTVLVRRENDAQRHIVVNELEERNWVRLWFVPPGRGEYPTDVTARQIEVVDRP